MKNFLLKLLLVSSALIPAASFSQVTGGVYAVVPYDNNPFLFCTLGMPSDGWKAINPATGTWTAIRHYPNLYWVPTYQAICPRAFAGK